MSKIYEIDPEADTLIVVRPLPESFAQWPDAAAPLPARNGAAAPVADVRIKVSSKHLSLASPRFRDLLAAQKAAANGTKTNGAASPTTASALWRSAKESPAADADGRVHLVLDGLDADATTTVLNIVHGRAGKDRVPKTLTLDALARIAVVVDRFQLQDVVDIYADRWIDSLYRLGLPSNAASRRSLVLWIYVAYVFERDAIFREATKIAATQLTGPLPALPHLPLRAKIAQDIDAQRQEAITQALGILTGAVDTLVADEAAAADDGAADDGSSDTFLLGSLIRTLHRNKLFWPQPAPPFAGVSVAAISRAAHDVQTQVWRLAFRIGDTTRSNRTNNRLLLTPQLDTLRANVAGLPLKSDLGYRLY